MLKKIERLERNLIAKGSIIDYYRDTMKIPNGNTASWDYIDHKGAAAVVAVTKEGRILMVRQYRNALERETLEIPAGGLNSRQEPMEEAAKRELQEETGAVKFEIKPICVYSVTGKTRVNNTGEETFGLLCFAEITEFAKELHSEMEKVVLMDKLPENWTYPLIQPKLIEKYLQMKNFVDDTL